MRILPTHLVRSILVLSYALAQDAQEDSQDTERPQLSLWDVGFSMQRQWGWIPEQLNPVDQALECPIPSEPHPDIIHIETEADSLPGFEVPTAGDDFVSFEEWKRIKQADAAVEDGPLHDRDPEPAHPSEATEDVPKEQSEKAAAPAPVEEPKKHKYNYASPDCSARIHSASPQTQQASSLLHKSRDRYMLTPCKADQHWVVVELCDEIRIEAVEIAVWEFFSSVVREVRVSVDEDGDAQQWKEVASFVGKNVRGVQTFTLPEATSFHRFVRLDFPSHYGSEYYCPISLLKVFGMNQMEAFKWEQKRIASSQKEKEKEQQAELEERRRKEEQKKQEFNRNRREEELARERELGELEKLVHREALRAGHIVEDSILVSSSSSSSSESSTSSTQESSLSPSTTLLAVPTNHSTEPSIKTSENAINETTSTPRPTSRSEQSESIFVSITRRLAALEGNSSLIARYIEEQGKVIRSALAVLEQDWDEWRLDRDIEDRSRWAEDRMRQEDRLGKLASQLERQRAILEADRQATAAQLRALADELSYERRRGLAQMGIMIVVITLGLISRSSAFEALLTPLVAEVRRRRSIRQRDGPLTGLRIDMGANRPPAVIGRGPPEAASPTPKSRSKQISTPRRPGTPSKRRPLSLIAPPFRSFSASDHPSSLRSRPAAYRRLARSSHLHSIEQENRHHEPSIDENIDLDDTHV